ncbi:DUF4350 domain-containing protein [Methanocella arvoryzae]|uniref:DUF4350 domain-containing protein n=1 Tax=Methanocella arvoryzae (strain DSM 22066 / NBRC 105507 / MRE50) TaxID=351160 RepID=Q0W4E2_METAR|nr:DUF4350 domain-containing protein [Methanocella arvoryzae]CAJ36751.1 conserved hypothetical protein [Methanocella arvoryzae MRE50]
MKKTTLILTLAAIVIVVLLVGRFYFSEADFSLSNPAWNGMAGISGDVNSMYSFSALPEADANGTLLIVGPTQNYTEQEAGLVQAYMDRGGRTIVMDDYGTANSLLELLGSPVTLYQQPLCQDGSFYRTPAFPIIDGIGNSGVLSGTGPLYFNHPVPLNVTGPGVVLASTSSLAWIDSNDNARIDEGEQFGTYPVAASVSYGKGELVVIGDPDLLINSMVELGNNSAFIGNVVSKGPVYVDASHGHGAPPLAVVYHLLKTDIVTQVLLVLLTVLAGYGVYRRADILGRFAPSKPETGGRPDVRDDIISYMMVKLPLTEREAKELKKKL